MPVVGIDLGTESIVLSLAFRGGVDIVLNDFSKRATPAIVGFTDRERIFGDAALNSMGFNGDNTIPTIKRVIGLKYSQVPMNDWAFFPCKAFADQNDEIIFEVKYLNTVRHFTPVQVLAMLFTKTRMLAEEKAGVKGVEAVVSVPAYFTDRQRRAVMQALEVANIRCVALVNDLTAAAIEYAIYRTFTDEQPSTVAFTDIGHGDSSVSIATFTKTKMKVLATTFLRDFGGATIDRVIFDILVDDIKNKYNLDVLSNKKAINKLMRECGKLKKTLSGFPIAMQRIECFMNDTDVSLEISRDSVEKHMETHYLRLDETIKQCIANAKLKQEDISCVELLGGCSYIPNIKKVVSQSFGQSIMTTLNATECIARGLAFQGAMLTPYYHLARELTSSDTILYPINSGYKPGSALPDQMEIEGNEEEIKQSPIFKAGETTPNSKILTFTRHNDFDVYLMYDKSANRNASETFIGKYRISKVPNKPSKIKVRIRHNINGIASVEDAQLIEEIETLEEIKPTPAPAQPQQPAAQPQQPAPADQPAPTVAEEPKPEQPKPEPQYKKVMKTIKTDLPVSAHVPCELVGDVIQKLIRGEQEMISQDALVTATSEAKNNLESAMYTYRDKIDTDYQHFLNNTEKENFRASLDMVDEWLMSEGDDSTRDEYVSRNNILLEHAKPAERRKAESLARPGAAQVLAEAIDTFSKFVVSTEEKYAHIEAGDRQKVLTEVQEAQAWLQEQVNKQSKLATYEDPVFTVDALRQKDKKLRAVCNPIMNKVKPAPPKVEEPKKEEKKEESQQTGAENKDPMKE